MIKRLIKFLKKVYELSKKRTDEKEIVDYVKSIGPVTLMDIQFVVESDVGGIKDVFDSESILSKKFNFEYVLSKVDQKTNVIYLKEA